MVTRTSADLILGGQRHERLVRRREVERPVEVANRVGEVARVVHHQKHALLSVQNSHFYNVASPDEDQPRTTTMILCGSFSVLLRGELLFPHKRRNSRHTTKETDTHD